MNRGADRELCGIEIPYVQIDTINDSPVIIELALAGWQDRNANTVLAQELDELVLRVRHAETAALISVAAVPLRVVPILSHHLAEVIEHANQLRRRDHYAAVYDHAAKEPVQ